MSEQAGVFDEELESLGGMLEDSCKAGEALRIRLVRGGATLTDIDARSLVQRLQVLGAEADRLRHALSATERRARAELDRQRVRARYRPEGTARILVELEDRATRSPDAARRAWLAELAGALAEREMTAAETLLDRPIEPDQALRSALPDLGRDLRGWRDGDVAAGRRMTDRLAVACAEDLASRRLARAARNLQLVRARLALDAGDPARAAALLGAGLPSIPQDALLVAELAAAHLAAGDQDTAQEVAARAVELAPDRADGYLHLGAVTESRGALDDAVDLYRQGCLLLNVASLEYLGRGSTLLRPTGLLHFERARRLEEVEYPRLSLDALDDALAAGVVGTARYPTAAIHRARTQVLERLGHPAAEIAAEALTAGKQLLWNGDVSGAVKLLDMACKLDRQPEAGWFLADAMLAISWPDGEARPDRERTEAAEQVWRSWLETVGAPARSHAWAYATGAILAEQRQFWDDGLDAFWVALFRIEKALVLDGLSASSWALCTRYLRSLHLGALAREAADRAFRLDPDDMDSIAQRLVTLVDTGRHADALRLLDRIPDAESDPWMLGLRGKILYDLGRHEEALAHVSRALEGEVNEGAYLDLRASVLVALGRLEDAVADLKELVERDPGSRATGRVRRARALAVLGRPAEARAELDTVDDQTVDLPAEAGLARTLVLLVSGDIDGARRQAEAVSARPVSRHEAKHLAKLWNDSRVLLRHQGRLSREALESLDAIAAVPPTGRDVEPTADEELRLGLERVTDDPLPESRTALLAIAARRAASAKRWAEAIERYEGLVGTPFQPEAEIALGDVLRDALPAAVQRGNVEEALALHDRLAGLGRSPYRSRALVKADAQLAVGDVRAALATLEHVAVEVDDDRERLSTYQRLGEVATQLDNGTLATDALDTALTITARLDDPLAAAQTRARLGIAWSLLRNHDAAVEHLVHALTRFKQAGALDPPYTLALELLGLIRKVPGRDAPEVLSAAYEDATHRLYDDAPVYANLTDSIREAGRAAKPSR